MVFFEILNIIHPNQPNISIDIRLTNFIEKGSYGEVFEMIFENENIYQEFNIPKQKKLCVKIVKVKKKCKEHSIYKELKQRMDSIDSMEHIVNMYMITKTCNELCYVYIMEYAMCDLYKYVYKTLMKQDLYEKTIFCRNQFFTLAETIQRCHSIQFFLVDIKPENILVFQENNSIQLKFTDFGLSKFEDIDEFHAGVAGTIGYINPIATFYSKIDNSISIKTSMKEQSDIFSLLSTFYTVYFSPDQLGILNPSFVEDLRLPYQIHQNIFYYHGILEQFGLNLKSMFFKMQKIIETISETPNEQLFSILKYLSMFSIYLDPFLIYRNISHMKNYCSEQS